MKKNILIASLALNVVLIAIALSGLLREEAIETISRPAGTERGDSDSVAENGMPTGKDSETPASGLAWAAIESSDYIAYIRNLRGVGCPEETIRDIVLADVDQLMLTRWRERHPDPSGWRYWEPRPRAPAETIERARLRHELRIERARLLQELLGFDVSAKVNHRLRLVTDLGEGNLDFLPQAKRLLVRDWRGRAAIAERELDAQMDRAKETAEARETKLRDFESDRLKELKVLLTPEEEKAYQLRYSSLAEQLREGLASVGVTEGVFQKAFDLFSELPGALTDNFRLNEPDGPLDNPFLMPRLQEVLGDELLQALHSSRNGNDVE